RKIMSTLKDKGIKLDTHFKNLYKSANNFKSYLIKPNLEYPMLGDTGQITENSINKRYRDFVDYDAGLAILQRKHTNNSKKSTYLTFSSGYQSKTHKHLDDLSITYYLNGHDLFIDPGKYSYDKNDKIRKYLISPEAHTTIGIKNKSYSLTNPYTDYDKLRIVKYYSTKNYRIISGINKLYENVSIFRTIVITDDPIVLIVDRVISKKPEIVTQNFNINHEAEIIKHSDLLYEIQIDDSKYYMESIPVNNKNVKSNIKDGFVSLKFSKSIKNKRIAFEQNSKSTTLITTVTENNVKVKDVKFEDKILYFECNYQLYNNKL